MTYDDDVIRSTHSKTPSLLVTRMYHLPYCVQRVPAYMKSNSP